MNALAYPHIEIEDDGIARIEGTRVKVVMIVEAYLECGNVAELQKAFPALTLAQIHAALAYYYDHHAAIDTHIQRRREAYEFWKQKSEASPLTQRVRAMKQAAVDAEPK